MTPERWRQVKKIFHSAVDRPPEERSAFLVEACAGDASLLETVTSFLASHLEAPDFLEAPAADLHARAEPEPHELGLEGRFLVRRRLGAGAFGVVYEVLDRDRDAVVALKILYDSGPANLYRFKQEFRALADVAHPNLVTLYELQSASERWFFTMERIGGVDLIEHVRGAPAETIRAVMRQLAQGIEALHAAGKLHRDVKPSNVLVTPEGRVVLLDFGLVTDAAPGAPRVDWGGTPAYMSPEQAAGRSLTTASDWYNVGAMLFEVLTGAVPFSGPVASVLLEKQRADPPPPSALAAGLPEDLESLCRDLLQRDPAARPRGHEVLRRLAPLDTAVGADAMAPDLNLERTTFVGRAPHLAALRQALRDTRKGRAVAVHVHGPSGLGKSALLRHFLAEVRNTDPAAVVVAGRCYEQESVPYKALDGVVDALTDHLASLAPAAAKALLPPGLPSLARLFPAMRRVQAVERACHRGSTPLDPAQSRRTAFQALRDLVDRVARQRTLVLAVDDLQWGDLDSAEALAELLRAPAAPPLLFIASYRSEELGSPFLAALLARRGGDEGHTAIAVAEMTPAETHELASTLLAQRRVANPAQAEAIARSAAGSPLFIQELVHQQAEGGASRPPSGGGPGTLEAALHARVGRLPAVARRLLETVALAGGPVELSLAARAANAGSSEDAAFSLLRAAHLVRTRAGPRREVEAYHDRIRETVVAQLSPEVQRDHHARLAETLEASGRADPEALAAHFHASGQPAKAVRHALAAATNASEALAFDRAARLYRLTLDLGPPEGADRRVIALRLAEALSNAGRGAEAAVLYVSALDGASRTEKLELQRRAAEQLLFSGHVDEGIELLRVVLRAQGQRLAPTPRRALLSYLARRLWLAVRGWSFQERPPSRIDPAALMRLDTYGSTAMGLSLVDIVRGADYHLRHLLLALRTGEPYRAALALASAVTWQASAGGQPRHASDALAARAAVLAERAQNPHATAMVELCVGLAALFRGEWDRSGQLLERAEVTLRERCVGVTWELDTARIHFLVSLLFRGAWKQMSDRGPAVIREAQERRDVFLETSVRLRCSYASWLAEDDPERAEEEIRRGLEPWSRQDFTLQHCLALLARAQIALYCGPGAEAKRLIDRAWPQLVRSLLLRVQLLRIETLHLRARSGLAAARALAGGPDGHRSAALLASVEKDARRIAREKTPWGNALASLLEAELCAFARREVAPARFEAAEERLRAADMPHYAAAARHRRGELTNGEDGGNLRESASAWMASQGIRNPQRMAAMLAP